jgi:hypothetical protein
MGKFLDGESKKYESMKAEIRLRLREQIDNAASYNELFEIIKRVVEMQIGRHRAGLALILQDMPNALGAYYPVGTNTIVLNKALVSGMRSLTQNEKEVNYFVFVVLMHEYLHTLGFLSEAEVRKQCESICRSALGEDHPTVKLATANWLEMHPELGLYGRSRVSDKFEVVDKFDSSSTSYIG